MPFCIHCGREVPDGVQVCTNCARSLKEGSPSGAQQLPRQGSNNKVIGLVFGIIAGLFMIFAGIDMASIRSIAGDTVMEAYYNAMGWGFMGLGIFCIVVVSFLYVLKSR